MTWLGKILTFVVMLGAVVWAYFSVQMYVTRVNWKAELDRERVARKASEDARATEARRYQVAEEALKRNLDAESKRVKDYLRQIKELGDAATKTSKDYEAQQLVMANHDQKEIVRQTEVARTLKELVEARQRRDFLENQVVALLIDTQNAKKGEVKALNEAKLALAIADENAKKVEELIVRVNELKQSGGSATATVLKSIDRPAPPLLANTRGEVVDTADNLVTISIGIDAGVSVGSVFDLSRLEGGGRYLGTVKVTSALNLFPKMAIGTFTPARNVPLERLRPEELPKKGDEIRPQNAVAGGQ